MEGRNETANTTLLDSSFLDVTRGHGFLSFFAPVRAYKVLFQSGCNTPETRWLPLYLNNAR